MFFKFHQEIIIIDAGSLTGDTSFRQKHQSMSVYRHGSHEEQFSTGNF